MKLTHLKDMMLLPIDEISINQMLIIKDVRVQIMCITKEKNLNTIWAIYENKQNFLNRERHMPDHKKITNREIFNRSILEQSMSSQLSIRKLTLQGQDFTVSSSSSRHVSFNDMESLMKLQHFAESKVLPTFLNEIDIDNICIAQFTQKYDETNPTINLNKEINITVRTGRDHHSVLLNTPLRIGFDKLDQSKHTFYNSMTKKYCVYYLQPLELYDIWHELKIKFDDERFKTFTQDQKLKCLKTWLKALKTFVLKV